MKNDDYLHHYHHTNKHVYLLLHQIHQLFVVNSILLHHFLLGVRLGGRALYGVLLDMSPALAGAGGEVGEAEAGVDTVGVGRGGAGGAEGGEEGGEREKEGTEEERKG